MKTNQPSIHSRFRSRQGFTLIELLAVIVIMGVVLAFAIPSVVPLMRSSSINKGVSQVTDALNNARQIALTQNRDVEFRFYYLPSKSNTSDLQYRAFRCFAAIGTSSIKSPLSNVTYLPEPVIIAPVTVTDSAGDVLTTLFNTTLVGPSAGNETPGLPGTGASSTPYISFLFRASGETNLDPNGDWYLTLYLENAPKNPATGIPDNYFTAQVDPVTGRVRSYRP